MAAPQFLIVPEAVWTLSADLLARYSRGGTEGGLFWYGIRQLDTAVAILAGVPNQINRPRNFAITGDALAALTREIPEPLVMFAQLHLHPGSDTNHSEWDDERAASRKALSIVIPNYGSSWDIHDAGIHECRNGTWTRLERSEIEERIRLLPSHFDTRQ